MGSGAKYNPGEPPADHTVTGPRRGRGGEGQRELRLDMAREGTGPHAPGGKASWEGSWRPERVLCAGVWL